MDLAMAETWGHGVEGRKNIRNEYPLDSMLSRASTSTRL